MIWNAKPTGFIEHIYLDNILDSNLNCKFLNTQILKIINGNEKSRANHWQIKMSTTGTFIQQADHFLYSKHLMGFSFVFFKGTPTPDTVYTLCWYKMGKRSSMLFHLHQHHQHASFFLL